MDELALQHHFLVAMPSLNNITYSHSVIYVCEHHEKGTVGLIVNQPLDYSFNYIFEQLHINAQESLKKNQQLLFGGPIQPERGFVIHRQMGNWLSSLSLSSQDVTITTSRDIIQAIAINQGPKDACIALGYVCWSHLQLEKEIMENVWLVCPFKAEILYDVPYIDRWRAAGLLLGVKMDQLISDEGHA